jgi:deaminated glutathione amidase
MLSSHDIDANLAKITETACTAATAGAALAAYPEAAMHAFGAPLADIAEPPDGAFGSSVERLTRDLGITIVIGMFTSPARVRPTARSSRFPLQ